MRKARTREGPQVGGKGSSLAWSVERSVSELAEEHGHAASSQEPRIDAPQLCSALLFARQVHRRLTECCGRPAQGSGEGDGAKAGAVVAL